MWKPEVVSFQSLSALDFRQGLSLNLELRDSAGLAGQWASEILLSLPFPLWNCRSVPLLQDFYMGFGDMLAWQTEPSPAPIEKNLEAQILKSNGERHQSAEVRRQNGDRSAWNLIPITNSKIETCPEIILKDEGQEKLCKLSSLVTTGPQDDSKPFPPQTSLYSHNDKAVAGPVRAADTYTTVTLNGEPVGPTWGQQPIRFGQRPFRRGETWYKDSER